MASKVELIKLEKSLESILLGVEILKKGIGLYVYYNKPNERTKIFKIHHSACGNCAWGTGKISSAQPGLNGVWIGPFTSVLQAETFINENFNPQFGQIEICSCTI
jgi:hypothetical protein